ncbi:MAG: hypothetical protein ACAH11_04320 [Sphingomonas sp.]
MRKLLLAAALTSAGFALTAAAPAPLQDVLDQIKEKTDEFFASKGFSPTGFVSNGALGAGETKTVTVNLKGGTGYGIIGICDSDCGDLNLNLINSNGDETDNDVKDDDLPMVVTADSGAYSVKVSMVKCKVAKCRFRIIAYSK